MIATDRFWSNVDKTGDCWLWTRYRTPKGYGQVWWNGALSKAHRVAYELVIGPIPLGLNVCHTCDNPPCVNPAHLFAGTKSDNAVDAVLKGRVRSVKLSPDKVREIRTLSREGASYRSLGRRYGVSGSLIRLVCQRKVWAHVA